MQHGKSGFGEVVDLVLVGLFDVGADEHEFLDAEVRKCLPDRLGRRDRRATTGALNRLHQSGLMGEPIFHGIGGTVKNNHIRLGVRQCLRRLRKGFLQLARWLAPLARHAQPGNVNARTRRCVLVELRLGEPITGRNDQTDACLSVLDKTGKTKRRSHG